jgi:hypothetical protein
VDTPTEARFRERPLQICFDLHNTLDDGSRSGRIPQSSELAVKRAANINGGSIVYCCSYIGRSLGEAEWKQRQSADLRTQATDLVYNFAQRVGLDFEDEHHVGATPSNFFFIISNRKQWAGSPNCLGYLNGKVSVLRHFGGHILVDDDLGICEEVAQYGYLPYHIQCRNRDALNIQPLYELGYVNHSFPNVEAAVQQIEADFASGALDTKLRALARVARELGPVIYVPGN